MYTYNVKITDRLLRFDTTSDSVTVILLPFAQTPNAPYEIHRTSTGDGNTVTIQVAGPPDFLLPDGSQALTLDDTTYTVYIKIPDNGQSPAYVAWGSGGGGGGGGPVTIPGAPPVTIDPPPDVLPRNNGVVEVDVFWHPSASANASNFSGAAVYLEDPDISSGTLAKLDGSTQLNATAQQSGQWAPIFQNVSTKSPAVVLIKKQAGDRDVRIYLAAQGPNALPVLNRANGPNPTPNIMVDVPGQQTGQIGQEYAFLVSNCKVNIFPDFDRPDPNYYLTFSYTPPDPTVAIPANLQPFSGCRIIYVPTDATDANPVFSKQADSGLFVPTIWAAGFKSPIFDPSHPVAGGAAQFRCYFCSEDTLGDINSLVEGVTPYALASVPQITPAPDVSNFQIVGSPATVWLADGSFVNQVTLSWTLPNTLQYGGVILYLVNVTGTAPLTKFPMALTAQQANIDTGFILEVPNGMGAVIPANDETWTIAAISISAQGALSDDPTKYGQTPPPAQPFHSPTVTWTVGPPQPGSAGSGIEHAPLVTINSGATVTATETTSSDGVRMVSFQVGTWTDPTSNQFGGAKVAMIVNGDTNHPTYWDAGMATSFTTPTMPAMGTIGGPAVPISFYIVSYDPQGNQNQLQPGPTPVIPYPGSGYTPTAGAVIPARSGWFDPQQFAWPQNGSFSAGTFSASNIYVGASLVVGGSPASFGGQSNGQIAVEDSGGNLLGWIGKQQPSQVTGGTSAPGQSQPLYGAWFKQLWVGGNTGPLTAPLWIDYQGIVVIGGISAANGSQYPYLSIRDSHGLEMGRMGAQISTPSGSGSDNTGPSPPSQLTAGAWFTQLAVGGNSLTNWNILITPSPSNPLGSNFQMRNIALLSIDYPYNSAPSGYFNNEYRFDVGNSVWMAAGLPNGTYVFPGIHIYEVDNVGNNFGSTFINRGMVCRGTQGQGYQVLLSLVTFNGNSSGQDTPSDRFWGELTFYRQDASVVCIDLSAGSTSSLNPYFQMFDKFGNSFFWVDVDHFALRVNGVLQGMNGAPIEANAYAIYGYSNPSGNNQVIDSGGHWVGQPITSTGGSQSPWTGTIQGAGHDLQGAGNITAASINVGSGSISGGSASISGGCAAGSFALVTNPGSPVINSNGAFIGAGVNVGGYGVGCGSVSCGASATQGGEVIASGPIVGATFAMNSGGGIGATVINSSGSFVGSGVDVGAWPNGLKGGALSCGATASQSGQIACLMLTCYSTTINNGGISTNSVYSSGGYTGGNISITGSCSASYGFSGGAFTGAGVNCPQYGIGCGSLQLNGGPINGVGSIAANGQVQCGSVSSSGVVNASQFQANGTNLHNGTIWTGSVQANAAVYGSSFGIYGVVVGATQTVTVATPGGGSTTLRFNGGLFIGSP